MKLAGFGGIFPWIGFRRQIVPCEDAADMGITHSRLAPGSMDCVLLDMLEIEWFGLGVVLVVKPVP